MSQSYKNRFKGHEEEIRNDLALLGESPTAEKWGAVPSGAFHEYATKILGHPPQYATRFAHSDLGQLAHYIVVDLLATLQSQKEEIARLQSELAQTHEQIKNEHHRVKMSGVELMKFLGKAKV